MKLLAVLLLALLIGPTLAYSAAQKRSAVHRSPPLHARSKPATPTPRLTLQLQPTDVTIDSGKGADLILTSRNPGTTTIAQAELKLLVPTGVKASFKPDNPSSGAGDLVWAIHVEASGTTPQTYKLLAELKYSTEGASPNTDIAVATITQQAPVDLASSIKATLVPSDANIDQFHPLDIYLQFQNTDRRPATLSNFRVLSPSSYVIFASTVEDKTLQPGETTTVQLTLRTADKVMPGPYTLALGYLVKPEPSATAGELATVQGKVTIGIPGVSDVMQLLGVSSFLLLPGVLTVVAFFAVFARFTATRELEWKSPTLIMIAVTLSFCYAVTYPFIVSVIWQSDKPNYLRGYNLTDAFWIWVGSVAAGGVAAVLAALLAPYVVRFQRRWEPSTEDTPVDILRKLAHHKANFNLYRWLVRAADGATWNPEVLLPLPFGRCPEDHRWVVKQGRIVVTPAGARRRANIIVILDKQPWIPTATSNLYREITAGEKAGELTVEWIGGITPHIVAQADFQQDGLNRDRLVDF